MLESESYWWLVALIPLLYSLSTYVVLSKERVKIPQLWITLPANEAY